MVVRLSRSIEKRCESHILESIVRTIQFGITSPTNLNVAVEMQQKQVLLVQTTVEVSFPLRLL